MPIGPMELIAILVIVLFVFGAGKLPEVGKALGQGMREFRQATQSDTAAKPSEEAKKEMAG